jgi:hypothetical protein
MNNAICIFFLVFSVNLSFSQTTRHVNSATGNDANAGTIGAPYKTFHRAYTVAASGDIINLTGTFDWTATDETGDAVTSGYTIAKSMTIRGQGADQTIIQANALPDVSDRRVFTINSGVTIVLEKLTIQNGKVANLNNTVSGANGGGINNSGTLTLNYCSFNQNIAIAGPSLSGGAGGAIIHLANNTMTINGCTFYNNQANNGGALVNEFNNTSGLFIITNSTFAYNKQLALVATVGGGALFILNGNNIITNSTFAYNDLNNSNGSGTGQGASMLIRQGNVKLKNSIFVNGTRSGQPLGSRTEIAFSGGTATDEGNNIFGNQANTTHNSVLLTFNATSWQPSSGGGYQNVGDNTKKCVLNVETVLGSNGATNGTVSLKTTGLNIEEGSTVANNGISIPTVDQRGLTRVGTPDIGAYEYTDIEPFVTCFSPSTGAAGTSVAIKGINLTGASSVKFNSVEATSYTVNSGVSITAIAPQSTTGLISVTTNQGTANSSSNYTYPPLIVKTGTLSPFTKCSGSASAAQTFTVSGSNLTANLVVATYTNLEYSLDGTSYSASLSLTPTSGSVATTTIYVRMTAASASLTSGNISITSTNATTQTFAASGTVNALPTITGTLSLTTNTSQLTGSGTAAASNPWVSSNTSVATVSNTGLVTPISSGTSTITYTNSLGCSITATVTVTMPTITTSVNSLSAFSGCPNLESTTQNFTVSGTNLSANISIAAPTGFEISTAATSGFSSTLTLTRSSGIVASTTIYARMAALSSSPSAGNISLTTTNATTKTIAVSGEVISGGIIAGSASVCTGTNSTVLTLSGHTATIEKWQSSTSSTFASAVTDISNTNTTHTASNLSTTTYYRAKLLNTCPVYSTIAKVTVSPDPVVTGTLDVYEDNTTQLACTDAPAVSSPWISLNTSLLTTSNTGLITGIYPGIGTVVYTTSIGCKDTVTVNVHETEWTGNNSNNMTTGANWKLNSQPTIIKKIRFNSNAANNLVLSSILSLDSIDFGTSNRQIELGNNDLIVNHIRNFNANRYIKTTGTGKVKKQLTHNTSFTFPLGNASYNPITITNKTGVSDTFAINLIDSVFLNGTSGVSITNPHVKRTWNISKNNANSGSGIDMIFNWNNGDIVGTLVAPTLNHHNGTNWEIPSSGNTTVSGNSLTYTGYTGTFSPFAIGGSSTVGLPVELKNFDAICNADFVKIDWTTASEKNNDRFELYKSFDAKSWTKIYTVKGQGTKVTDTKYTFNDIEKGDKLSYYKLIDFDLNGYINESPVIVSDCDFIPATIAVSPNPAKDYIEISVPFEENSHYNIMDLNGKIMKSGGLLSRKTRLNIEAFAAGIYIVEIVKPSEKRQFKIIKQ